MPAQKPHGYFPSGLLDLVIDPTIQQLVSHIHTTPHQAVFKFAGAGSLALFWLHSIAGSSRTILEAIDHYAVTSTIDLLGYEPRKFVSSDTAQAMARYAYQRGLRLTAGNAPVIGISCTSTIATDYSKRGNHQCQVAICDRKHVTHYAVTFIKGKRDRFQEENVVSQIVIRGLAEACGLAPSFDLNLDPAEPLRVHREYPADPLDQLLRGTVQTVAVYPNGRMVADETLAGVSMLSGSFNPLHEGHRRLAQVAAATLRCPTIFELPIINAEKEPIDYLEICRRLSQFGQPYHVVLTRAPLFHEKAQLFPNRVFVVGFDTAARLVELRFYGDNESRLRAAFDTIQEASCRFLVAGRLWRGQFRGLTHLAIPPGYKDLFQAIPEDKFRVDISSAMLKG